MARRRSYSVTEPNLSRKRRAVRLDCEDISRGETSWIDNGLEGQSNPERQPPINGLMPTDLRSAYKMVKTCRRTSGTPECLAARDQ